MEEKEFRERYVRLLTSVNGNMGVLGDSIDEGTASIRSITGNIIDLTKTIGILKSDIIDNRTKVTSDISKSIRPGITRIGTEFDKSIKPLNKSISTIDDSVKSFNKGIGEISTDIRELNTEELRESNFRLHEGIDNLIDSNEELLEGNRVVSRKIQYLGTGIKSLTAATLLATRAKSMVAGELAGRVVKKGVDVGLGAAGKVAGAPIGLAKRSVGGMVSAGREYAGDTREEVASSTKKGLGTSAMWALGGPGALAAASLFGGGGQKAQAEKIKNEGIFYKAFSGLKNVSSKSVSGAFTGLGKFNEWFKAIPKDTKKDGIFRFAPAKTTGGEKFKVEPDENFKNDLKIVSDSIKDLDLKGDPKTNIGSENLKITKKLEIDSSYNMYKTTDRAEPVMLVPDPSSGSKSFEESIISGFETTMRNLSGKGGLLGKLAGMTDSIFGIRSTVAYALPIFGAGYRSELPRSGRSGPLPAILETLGLIYVHNRFASKESNDLMLQLSRLVKLGFNIEGTLHKPQPRSLSEMIGSAVGDKISSTLGGPDGPLTYMKEAFTGKIKGAIGNLLGFGQGGEGGGFFKSMIPGYAEWEEEKKRKSLQTELRRSPALSKRLELLTTIHEILDRRLLRKNEWTEVFSTAFGASSAEVVHAQTGGTVKKSGLSVIHEGETVVPKDEARPRPTDNNADAGGGGFLGRMFGGIFNFFSGGFFKKIWETIKTIPDRIVSGVRSVWEVSTEYLRSIKENIADLVKTKFPLIAYTLMDIKKSFTIGSTLSDAEAVDGKSKSVSGGIIQIIKDIPIILEKSLNTLGVKLQDIFYKQITDDSPKSLLNILARTWQDLIPKAIGNTIETSMKLLKDSFVDTLKYMSTFVSVISDVRDTLVYYAKVVTNPLFENLSESEGMVNKTLAIFKSIPDMFSEMKDSFGNFYTDIQEIGIKVYHTYTGFQGSMMQMLTRNTIAMRSHWKDMRVEIIGKIIPEHWSKIHNEIESRLIEITNVNAQVTANIFSNLSRIGITIQDKIDEEMNLRLQHVSEEEDSLLKRALTLSQVTVSTLRNELQGSTSEIFEPYTKLMDSLKENASQLKAGLIRYSDTFEESMESGGKVVKESISIGERFKNIYGNLADDLGTIVRNMKTISSEIFGTISSYTKWLTGYDISNIKEGPTTVFGYLLTKMDTVTTALIDEIKSIGVFLRETLEGYVPQPQAAMAKGGIVQARRGIITQIGEAGDEVVIPLEDGKATDRLIGWFTSAFAKMGFRQDAVDSSDIVVNNIYNEVKAIRSLLEDGFGNKKAKGGGQKTSGGGLIGTLINNIVELPFKFTSVAAELIRTPIRMLNASMSIMTNTITGAINFATETMTTAIRTVRATVSGGLRAVQSTMGRMMSVITKPLSLVANIIKSPFQFISKGFSSITDKIKGVIGGGSEDVVSVGPDGTPVKAKWPKTLNKGIRLFRKEQFDIQRKILKTNIAMYGELNEGFNWFRTIWKKWIMPKFFNIGDFIPGGNILGDIKDQLLDTDMMAGAGGVLSSQVGKTRRGVGRVGGRVGRANARVAGRLGNLTRRVPGAGRLARVPGMARLGGIAGKAAAPLAVLAAGYGGYKGWGESGEIFGGDEATFGQKMSSSIGGIVESLSFGLISMETAAKKFYGLKDAFESLKKLVEPLKSLFNNIKTVFSQFIDVVTPVVDELYQMFKTGLTAAVKGLTFVIEEIIDIVNDTIIPPISMTIRTIATITEEYIIPGLHQIKKGFVWVSDNVIKPIAGIFLSSFREIGESIGSLVDSHMLDSARLVFDSIKSVFGAIVDVIEPVVGILMPIIKTTLKIAFGALTGVIKGLVFTIKNVIVPAITGVVKVITGGIDLFIVKPLTLLGDAIKGIGGILGDAITWTKNAVVEGFRVSVLDPIIKMGSIIKSTYNLLSDISGFISSSIIGGIASFIADPFGALKSAIENIGTSLMTSLNWIKSSVADKIPELLKLPFEGLIDTIKSIGGSITGILGWARDKFASLPVVGRFFGGKDTGEDKIEEVSPVPVAPSSNDNGKKSMLKSISDSVLSGLGNFMAEGGIVTKPTRAVIGEAGPEAVIPLRNLEAMVDAIMQIAEDIHVIRELTEFEMYGIGKPNPYAGLLGTSSGHGGGHPSGTSASPKPNASVTTSGGGIGSYSSSGNMMNSASSSSGGFDFGGDVKSLSGTLSEHPDILTAIKKQIMQHEGVVLRPYKDSRGFPTIGVGHLIKPNESFPPKITMEQAKALYDSDFVKHYEEARKIPGFDKLDPVRQGALVDMVFNMGLGKVLGFRNTLAAIRSGDYEKGAQGILNSAYATQVGRRAHTVANLIRTGDPNLINTAEPMIRAHVGGTVTGSETPAMLAPGEVVLANTTGGAKLFAETVSDILSKGLAAKFNEKVEKPLSDYKDLATNAVSMEKVKMDTETQSITAGNRKLVESMSRNTAAMVSSIQNHTTVVSNNVANMPMRDRDEDPMDEDLKSIFRGRL